MLDLTFARWSWLVVAGLTCSACNRIPEPVPSNAEPPAQSASTPSAAAAPSNLAVPEQSVASRDGPGFPRPGWSKRVVEDGGPICAVETYAEVDRASSVDKARPQKFQAGMPIAFETYGPGCINEACVQLPTVQCVVEADGHTLVVHSRYNGYHKDGAICERDCRPVYAGCETPILQAGKYTVHYGPTTFQLKIPGKLQDPCFGRLR
ncbi:MAG TPA: hypothetical protein VGI70_19440 [Polyangiales bacterium]|jgi:hypothetical protein